MIISMRPHASQEEIDRVCDRIREFGYKVNSIVGEERVVIGACVDPAFYETSGISARFSQTMNVQVEASTPPYAVVHQVYEPPGRSRT